MKPIRARRLIWLIAAIGWLVSMAVSCGSPEATEPIQEDAARTAVATADTFDSPLSPSVTPEPLVPETGLAGAYGVIVSFPAGWQGQNLFCWFAPYYPSEDSDGGFFLLEPSEHPSVAIETDGSFELLSIPPGEYVIVFGPSPESALAIQDARGPRVFELSADTSLDLGEIELDQ